MGRLEMVENRKAELEKLSDVELVNAIARYFENNHTMPGEKDLKDTALMLLSEFTDGSMTGLISQLRDTLIETFASVCVKTTKLKHPQAADSTKKNREAGLKLVDDLIMVRTGTYNRTVKGADGKDRVVTRDVYEMPGSVDFPAGLVYVKDRDSNDAILTAHIGSILKGFRKNHYDADHLVDCVIEATDYSEGKMANMGWQMHVDLGASCMEKAA